MLGYSQAFFEIKNNVKRLFIILHFCNLKMEEGSKVSDFMRIVKEIFNELVKFDDNPLDNVVLKQVNNVLVESFDTFVHVIFNEKDANSRRSIWTHATRGEL